MSIADDAIALGLPVFPCSAGKRPVVPKGLHDASTDPTIIRLMFAHPAAALIGVRTGRASDIVAIDVDVRDGKDGLTWLRTSRDLIPPTRVHRTRSGGAHFLLRPPAGTPIPNSASRIAPGVDVRGDGGYIIYPPSTGYAVLRDLPIADTPPALITLCMPPPRPPAPARPPLRDGSDGGTRALRYAYSVVSGAREGQRNCTLNGVAYWLAQLAGDGVVALKDAAAVLFAAAQQAGLAPPEIQATIRSAFNAGISRARS